MGVLANDRLPRTAGDLHDVEVLLDDLLAQLNVKHPFAGRHRFRFGENQPHGIGIRGHVRRRFCLDAEHEFWSGVGRSVK